MMIFFYILNILSFSFDIKNFSGKCSLIIQHNNPIKMEYPDGKIKTNLSHIFSLRKIYNDLNNNLKQVYKITVEGKTLVFEFTLIKELTVPNAELTEPKYKFEVSDKIKTYAFIELSNSEKIKQHLGALNLGLKLTEMGDAMNQMLEEMNIEENNDD